MWPKLKPFAMTSPFTISAPGANFTEEPAVGSGLQRDQGLRWSIEYEKRSARQTEDARFWLAPGPVIYYPVVREVAVAKKLDVLRDSARLMALVAVASIRRLRRNLRCKVSL